MSRFERHLRELAAELGAELYLQRDRPADGVAAGWAHVGRSASVVGWHGNSHLAYFAGLHELGHIAKGHVDSWKALHSRYTIRTLDAEAEAWEWALEHSIIEPSGRVLDYIRTEWLGSYADQYNLRGTGGRVFKRVASRIGLSA